MRSVRILSMLLLSGCAQLASDGAIIGCQAADVGTTAYALRHGAVEANPLLQNMNIGTMLAVKALLAWGIVTFVPKQDVVARSTLNVLACGTAIHNINVVR